MTGIKGITHPPTGTGLEKTEYESAQGHDLAHGTDFPDSPSERDLFYRDDLHQLYQRVASTWLCLSAGIPQTASAQSISETTTTSGTKVDLDSISITHNVKSTASKLLLLFHCIPKNSLANQTVIFTIDRGTQELSYQDTGWNHDAEELIPIAFFTFDSGVVGDQTYKAKWRVSSGTGYCYKRELLLIEFY